MVTKGNKRHRFVFRPMQDVSSQPTKSQKHRKLIGARTSVMNDSNADDVTSVTELKTHSRGETLFRTTMVEEDVHSCFS